MKDIKSQNMRILLVGEFSKGHLDEGYKNIAFNLAKELSDVYEVKNINGSNLSSLFSIGTWKNIKAFDPQIIHSFTAPSFKSYVFLKILGTYIKGSKTIISSLHPDSFHTLENSVLRPFISKLKPDLMLIQSKRTQNILKNMSQTVDFFPNGVNTEKFIPVNKKDKISLREKYKIDKDKFVILHVGHIRESRNIQLLGRIQKRIKDVQVIIIGSSYFKTDEKLSEKLKEDGCIILKKYFKNIEELYQLSDCYIFPPLSDTLFMPLSVLEAMSCNLPVISHKFDGLDYFLSEENGLFFAKNEDDVYNLLKKIMHRHLKFKTRNDILQFSWKKVSNKLDNIYKSVIGVK